MKQSRYNFLINNGDNYALYNAFSDQLAMLRPELYDFFVDNISSLDIINARHPQFFDYLVSCGFIVDDDADEVSEVVEKWKNSDESSTDFTLIINPTLKCNMNCWYCYESKGSAAGTMKEDVKRKIRNFISRLMSPTSKYKTLNLSFFGGEPLLAFDNVVKGIISEARDVCGKSGKDVVVHFTTNGYLLTNEVLDFLSDIETSFQIALEGNELVHNTVKSTKDGDNAYAVTIANIKNALEKGFKVAVRLNFTSETLPFFLDVISEFQDLNQDMKSLVNFNFQRIWQDGKGNGDYDNIVEQVRAQEDKFMKAGLFVVPFTSNPLGRCYADRANTATVNFDGRIFKCTARDFKEKNSDGCLQDDGSIVWNDLHEKRLSLVYCDDTCRRCKIFPLCHGGCSQAKIESRQPEGACLKGYDETQKTKVVYERIHDILTVNNNRIKNNRESSAVLC